jgi:hypothetical protein
MLILQMSSVRRTIAHRDICLGQGSLLWNLNLHAAYEPQDDYLLDFVTNHVFNLITNHDCGADECEKLSTINFPNACSSIFQGCLCGPFFPLITTVQTLSRLSQDLSVQIRLNSGLYDRQYCLFRLIWEI